MLGHDKAHKVQSVKKNFMMRGLQKMTIHRKADGLRCLHFWYGPWEEGRFFEFLEVGFLGRTALHQEAGAVRSESIAVRTQVVFWVSDPNFLIRRYSLTTSIVKKKGSGPIASGSWLI